MSDRSEMSQQLARGLASLVGQRCWGAVAGSGTGSVVSLSFGRMIPRTTPLANPHLSTAVRENEAELGLYIECAWRIDGPDAVVAGCWDDNQADGPMLGGLAQLIDQSVVAADVTEPAFDLHLRFSNGIVLRVFCDKTNRDDGDDNYSLMIPSTTLIVGCRSVVRAERRD
jgi:hypothetical protein